MICVAVTYLIQPGQEERAIELFASLTQQTHAEPGNLYYLVHRSPTEPRRFFLYEQYTDQAALDTHPCLSTFYTVCDEWPVQNS